LRVRAHVCACSRHRPHRHEYSPIFLGKSPISLQKGPTFSHKSLKFRPKFLSYARPQDRNRIHRNYYLINQIARSCALLSLTQTHLIPPSLSCLWFLFLPLSHTNTFDPSLSVLPLIYFALSVSFLLIPSHCLNILISRSLSLARVRSRSETSKTLGWLDFLFLPVRPAETFVNCPTWRERERGREQDGGGDRERVGGGERERLSTLSHSWHDSVERYCCLLKNQKEDQ